VFGRDIRAKTRSGTVGNLFFKQCTPQIIRATKQAALGQRQPTFDPPKLHVNEVTSEEQPGHCQHEQHFLIGNFTAAYGAP
jgi:hypothetical protein